MTKIRFANDTTYLSEQNEPLRLMPNGVAPYVKHPIFNRISYWDERGYATSYAHALGIAQLGWLQPGTLLLSDKPEDLRNESANAIKRNLKLDGLEEVEINDCNCKSDHVFAVVLKPREGYEPGNYKCVRINEGGQLSNIEGALGVSPLFLASMKIRFRMAVNNTENFFNVIKPSDFLTKKSPEFVGFFRIPKRGLLFTPIYRPRVRSELNYPYQRKGPGAPSA